MTDIPPIHGLESADELLREQAALWFSRMRGPDADSCRSEFEAWLARDNRHHRAYNRVAEIFSAGKTLRGQELLPEGKPRARVAVFTAFVAVILATGIGASFFVALHREQLAENNVASPLRFVTGRGEVRTVRLPDGSSVTLDTDSLLTLAYDASGRRLRLLRGRARFDVAHEPRSFVVAAGDGRVTAHGTLFDVRILRDRAVEVRLIDGIVDVEIAGEARPVIAAMRVTRLEPGQGLSFKGSVLTSPATVVPEYDLNWPNHLMDYDGAPLSKVIIDANRNSSIQIRLGDAGLNDLRVSGIFRVDNTEKLAERLGATFDLTVDRSNPSEIVLRDR
ncbi:transmembrane sensor [Sphingobium xanthum]|uniref:FecR family protein n=1 Tax=Sphingobium xanthum TaxID=1387165 RepID=UPI001C8B115C|nr:FecR domain-containing protein [Sphingobium xanthum]